MQWLFLFVLIVNKQDEYITSTKAREIIKITFETQLFNYILNNLKSLII